MTATARAWIAGLVLVLATGLSFAGVAFDEPNRSSYVTGAVSLYTLVLGYVFGNRNGEQQLAKALVQTQAVHGADAAMQVARDTANVATPRPSAVDSPPEP